MTSYAARRLAYAPLIALAALVLVLGAARVAHAFTYSTANGSTPDHGTRLQAGDKKAAKKTDKKTDKTAGKKDDDPVSFDGSVSFGTSGDVSVRFGARDAHQSIETEYDSTTYGPFTPAGH